MFIPQLLLTVTLALGSDSEAPVRPSVDLTRAAEAYAQAHAANGLPTPGLEFDVEADLNSNRRLTLNGYARHVLEYRRELADRLHFTMETRTLGPGPKLEFRPRPWLRFLGGPIYDPKYDSVDILVALKIDLWRFNL